MQKYLKVLGKIAEGSSTFWQKMNNLLVKTQGLALFPVRSWPFILLGQKIEGFLHNLTYLEVQA